MKKFLALLILHFAFCIFNSQASTPDSGWAVSFSGRGIDKGYAIKTDAAGNLYTIGIYRDTIDFDPGPGTSTLIAGGTGDCYLVKYDPSGNLIWAKSTQSTTGSYTYGQSLALDDSANIYITGYFWGTVDVDPGPSVYDLIYNGGGSMFICKLDSSGNFIWAKSMGGVGSNNSVEGQSVTVDVSGNSYIVGTFFGTDDFDPDISTTFSMTSMGYSDIFVEKLNHSGDFVWAKGMGGGLSDIGSGVAIDPSANVYATGWFWNTVDFDPDATGVFNITSGGQSNEFILKLDNAGNFVWASSFGGVSSAGYSITTDHSGHVYTTGNFGGTADFDPGAGVANHTAVGSQDIFISKLDTAGNYIWGKAIGGTDLDQGFSIAVDSAENVYTSGFFWGSADFNPDPVETFVLSTPGTYDNAFISKLDSSGQFQWARVFGGADEETSGQGLTVDASSNVYVTGYFFSSSLQCDNITLTNTDNTGNTSDIYVAKIVSCSAYFSVYPDILPHNWFALNQSIGAEPLSYNWYWGDGDSTIGATPSHTYSVPGYYNICLSIQDASGCKNTYCDSSTYLYRPNGSNSIITISVVSQLPTGVQEQQPYENEVSVYPNPATSVFTIDLGNYSNRVEVTITDLEGKTIFVADSRGTSKFNVNTTGFGVGVYAIRIQSADFVEMRKLIISN